ncbi:nascent polypeptide-associated complex subunit beta-like protein [Tanacetum coccineum]
MIEQPSQFSIWLYAQCDLIWGLSSATEKKEVVHKTTVIDDKRLQSTLKIIGVNRIPEIKEVNIFEDETVIQFLNLKAVVTLESLEIYTTHEWVGSSPTVYFLCNKENKMVLPDVKKT